MKNNTEKAVRNTVKKTIKDHGLIPQGSRVILALSGGPDSLCLLHILHALKEELGFELYALHVNHMLRGEDADLDEAFVKEFCEETGTELRTVRRDAAEYARENGLTVEEAGRAIRSEALAGYAKELGGALIAYAHNMDDQAETVLMRIMRGTGIHGLAAMEYRRADGVIRPLLDVPKKDTALYCERLGLNARIDATNASCDYTRNKIRNVLIPELSEYNPKISEALVRLAGSAREDDEALDRIAQRFVKERCESTGKEGSLKSVFLAKDLLGLENAVFMRVLAISLKNAGLTRDLSSERLAEIRKAVKSGRGGLTIELPRGVRVKTGRGRVEILPCEGENKDTKS